MASLSFIIGLIVVKKKSTENYKAIPYITTLLSTSLWTFYGLLKPGGLLIVTVNAAGAVLQFVYVTLFLIYAPKDIKRTVVKTKSVEYMPFTLSFFLFLNAGVWSVYALLVKDYYVGVPNAIGFVLGSAQLILYTIYNKKSPSTKSEVEREEEGSTNLIKNAIEMQGQNKDDPKSINRSLHKGSSLPKSSVSRQYNVNKFAKTLSFNPYELHSDRDHNYDVENGSSSAQ
ncbi:hypothetical protein C3L33_09133, partial [Rhododendron williamsianum]